MAWGRSLRWEKLFELFPSFSVFLVTDLTVGKPAVIFSFQKRVFIGPCGVENVSRKTSLFLSLFTNSVHTGPFSAKQSARLVAVHLLRATVQFRGLKVMKTCKINYFQFWDFTFSTWKKWRCRTPLFEKWKKWRRVFLSRFGNLPVLCVESDKIELIT